VVGSRGRSWPHMTGYAPAARTREMGRDAHGWCLGRPASASRMPHRVTRSSDSTIIRPDIFDSPKRRSRKMIGVSITRDPWRTRRRTSSVRKPKPSAVVVSGAIARRAAAR
jgi:hypothetical protein